LSQQSHNEIFPYGTYFGTPKITMIMLLIRDRYPNNPSPVFDRVWLEGGIETNLCDSMFAAFERERKEQLKKLQKAEEGEKERNEETRSVEM